MKQALSFRSKKFMVVGVLLMAILSITAYTYAATTISVIDGPNFNLTTGDYEATICTDTAFGETVLSQVDVTGAALTGDNNTNPLTDPSWNGDVLACSFAEFEPKTCGGPGSGFGTWTCTFTPQAPVRNNVNYRYVVVNQSGDFYGVEVGGAVSATAVQLSDSATSMGSVALVIMIATLSLGAVTLAAQWREQTQ